MSSKGDENEDKNTEKSPPSNESPLPNGSETEPAPDKTSDAIAAQASPSGSSSQQEPKQSALEEAVEGKSKTGKSHAETSSEKRPALPTSAGSISSSIKDGNPSASVSSNQSTEASISLGAHRSTRAVQLLAEQDLDEDSEARGNMDIEAGAFPFGGPSPSNNDAEDAGTIQYSAVDIPRSNEETVDVDGQDDAEGGTEELVVAELAPKTVLGTALVMEQPSLQPRRTFSRLTKVLIASLVAVAAAFVLYIIFSGNDNNEPTQQSNEASFSVSPSPTPVAREVIQPSEAPTSIMQSAIPTTSPTKWSTSPLKPTRMPAMNNPSNDLGDLPTSSPFETSDTPTKYPSLVPTTRPPTEQPTTFPTTRIPSMAPTRLPTEDPTSFPTTKSPSKQPTKTPTPFPTTGSPTAKPTSNPTTSASPTRYPTTSPTLSQAPTSVLQGLSSIFPNLPSSVSQQRALDWLLSADGAISFQDPSNSVAERFVMAVFFFASNGNDWLSSDRWLSSLSVCGWAGVTCIDGSVVEISRPQLNLTGTIPTEIEQLTGLAWLRLQNNALNGPIPSELGRLRSLGLIQLYGNSLTGTIPRELGQLSSLRDLELDQNMLSGTIPTELGRLTRLEDFDLFWNLLTGTIPTELGRLTRMAEFELFRNSLTGTIPTEIGRLTTTTRFLLWRNSLTGKLPTELGQLTRAEVFELDLNSLTGPLPTEYAQLTTTTVLHLQNNMLTGTIPTEYGLLSNARLFELDHNALTGTVPTELGLLSSVVELDMCDNFFTGSIPTEIGQLRNVVEIELDKNALTGTIPTELALLTMMTMLELDNNNLSGRIPEELDNLLQGLIVCQLAGNANLRDIPANCE